MKIEKMKLNKDFRHLYLRGKSFVSPNVVTYCLPLKGETVKFGITTGKKIGNAVKRNRARRVITAAFREIAPEISSGVKIVFVARTRILTVKSNTVAQDIRKHLTDFGVI